MSIDRRSLGPPLTSLRWEKKDAQKLTHRLQIYPYFELSHTKKHYTNYNRRFLLDTREKHVKRESEEKRKKTGNLWPVKKTKIREAKFVTKKVNNFPFIVEQKFMTRK